MVIYHVLQHHHGKGLKVFKIKKFMYSSHRLIHGFAQFEIQRERERQRQNVSWFIKKNPDGSIELKITENSLCTAACFYTDFLKFLLVFHICFMPFKGLRFIIYKEDYVIYRTEP